MPHIHCYGYHNNGSPIHLYELGEISCEYDNSDIQKQVDKLRALLFICISNETDIKCDYCHKLNANNFDEELSKIFCDDRCRLNYYENDGPLPEFTKPDRPVMMMRHENGRK